MAHPVVVGLDGSPESLAAAGWAAREAERRGVPLRMLHAVEGLASGPSHLPELDAPRERAGQILREATALLTERHPRVRTTAVLVARPPAEALAAACSEAELLVLGSRAFSGVGGVLAGSVALSALGRVTRPVVLVRAGVTAADERLPLPPGSASPAAHRHVVAGVDPAGPCEEVVAFAFDSAALRSAPLWIVHTWRLAYGHAPGTPDTWAEVTSRAAAERALAAVVRPWREKYPTVAVRETVRYGRAAQQLFHASADACLLVVGRRIRPRRAGAHIGPVTHAVTRDVPCPVAVVPHL
ncbi:MULTISPECIES: universal stress protein [unclassified Streptomyces]|uniref:universal stress protein n=1 Tax=unclassified Streptomyces TaxID=2593676 RepID=UPI0036FE8410